METDAVQVCATAAAGAARPPAGDRAGRSRRRHERRRRLAGLAVLVAVLVAAGALVSAYGASSASAARSEGAPPAVRPLVAWTAPADNATVTGSSVALSVTATSANGPIQNVMFFESLGTSARVLGTVTSSTSTFTYAWATAAPGVHKLGALALDSAGVRGGAPLLTVTTVAGTGTGGSGGGSTPPPPPPPAATYQLTVVGGTGATGSGSYPPYTVVTVSAGQPPAGMAFKQWVGGPVANSSSPTTTIQLGSGNVTLTAQFFTPAPIPQPVASHPRLWVTQADLPRLRGWASPSNPVYQQGLKVVIDQAVNDYLGKFQPFFGPTPPPAAAYPDPGDTQGYVGILTEEIGSTLAFASLIDNDPVKRAQYAGWARNVLMYAMNEAAKGQADGQPFRDRLFVTYNRANHTGQQWAQIVDWIYPVLSPQDKLTIRNVFLRWASELSNAYTSGGDHPSPLGVTNSSLLLPRGGAYRTASNNYYLGHARLLTMMALSLDPADDPAVDPTLPVEAFQNSLRSYIPVATGAWLYQEYAMMGDPAQVAADYGFSGANPTGKGFGLASGGLPPEGMLYGNSYGYLLGGLLALQTAGFGDPALSGPQIKLINAPVWDRFVDGMTASLVPSSAVYPSWPWLGPVYQMASYGDILRLWITPDTMQSFALLALLEEKAGRLDGAGRGYHSNFARWWATEVAEGGPSRLMNRITHPWSPTESILYFLVLDPTAPPATDPRPAQPLVFVDKPAGRIVARTGWDPNASMFDYRASWITINHQDADGGQFELYRKGEWLTKEMSNYDNNALGMTTPYHNTLSLQNWAQAGKPTNLNWYENTEWANGSQWKEGLNAGDPTSLISSGPGYVFAQSDLTNLYNRPSQFTPQNAAMDISHASRSIVWLGGDDIVTYDRATSVHTGLFKRTSLNVINQPTIGTAPGGGPLIDETTPNGQHLYVQSLLPAGATATAVRADVNLSPIAWLEPTAWQVTLENPAKPADVRFLNVLQGRDGGVAATAATLVRSSMGTGFDGAAWGSTAAYFARDLAAAFTGTTLPVPAGVHTVLVTGLQPGATYTLTATAGQVTLVAGAAAGGTAVTADSAGLLQTAV